MAYIVKQKTKTGRTNIYVADNHHIPGKGSRQTRRYLGVLSEDKSELFLCATSSEKISDDIMLLLEKKGIAFKGQRADGPGRKSTQHKDGGEQERLTKRTLASSATFEHGRIDLLRELASQSTLSLCLEQAFGKDLADRIFALSAYQVCESSTLYLASDWCEDNNINLGLSSSSVSRVLHAVGSGSSAVMNFFERWIESNGRPTSLIHDTTSISSYSNTISDIEWGYNRDDENLPQLNIAMVVERKKRIPLWYRVLPGSIPDVSSLKKTCEIVSGLGIDSFSFSLDRGFFSKANIASLIADKVDFIIGVPCHHKQPTELINNHYDQLKSIDRIMLIGESRIKYTSCIYKGEDTGGNTVNIRGHLFLDADRRDMQLKKLETGIAELLEKAKLASFPDESAAKKWINDTCGPLSKYFSTRTNDTRQTIILDSIAFEQDYRKCGVMLVLTSKNDPSPAQVLSDYRCRDIAEKVFDKIKNGVGFSRIRCQGNDNMEGRVFVAFVATVLRAIVEERMRSSGLLKKYSVDEALGILKKVRSFILPSGKIVKREIPARCREIWTACLGAK